KLHSLGPKNVRRTSEETPKKPWSRKGPDKTRTGKAESDGAFGKRIFRVNIYKSEFLLRMLDEPPASKSA
ncbi:hypothetical protein, partial [Bacteroides sp.]|uniref:hypothetical protein n=1 Tax=Bacteroides sp. TaxID=29523 RepID=UPI0023C6753E